MLCQSIEKKLRLHVWSQRRARLLIFMRNINAEFNKRIIHNIRRRSRLTGNKELKSIRIGIIFKIVQHLGKIATKELRRNSRKLTPSNEYTVLQSTSPFHYGFLMTAALHSLSSVLSSLIGGYYKLLG